MAITLLQRTSVYSIANAASASIAFPGALTPGSTIVVLVTTETASLTATVSDDKNTGNYTENVALAATRTAGCFSIANTAGAIATVSVVLSAAAYGTLRAFEIQSSSGAIAFDTGTSGSSTTAAMSLALTLAAANEAVFLAVSNYPNGTDADAGFTADASVAGSSYYHSAEYDLDVTSAGSLTLTRGYPSTITQWAAVAAAYKSASGTPNPALTSVGASDVITAGATGVAYAGTNLVGGTGSTTLALIQGSVTVAQTVDTATATGGTFDVVTEPGSGGQIKFGAATVQATRTSDSQSATIAATVNPPTGLIYVDVGTPNTTASNRITAVPDIVSGDQLEARGVGGGSAPTGLTLNNDATFTFASGDTPAAFDVRVWDSSDATWGAWATQSISSGVNASLTESGAATDAPSATYSAVPTLNESGTASDQLTAVAAWLAALGESGAAVDTVSIPSGAQISVRQETGASVSGGSYTSWPVSFTEDVLAGSVIHAIASTGGGNMTGVTDSQGNAYTQLGVATASAAGNNNTFTHWYAIAGASGPLTVTLNLSAATGYPGLVVREIENAAASPLVTHAEVTASFNNGTDTITTGPMTTPNAPVLVSAWCQDGHIVAAPTAGTGYTAGFRGSAFADLAESERFASGTSHAATFTPPSAMFGDVVAAVFQEASSITYSASLTEAGTAADSPSSIAAWPGALSEAGVAADSPAGAATWPATLAEVGTATDAPSATAGSVAAIAESGAVTDAPSSDATWPATVGEAAAAADTVSSGASAFGSLNESASAGDALSALAQAVAALAASGAAADQIGATLNALGSLSESGVGADALTAAARLQGALSELGAAGDTLTEIATAVGGLTETGSAQDAIGSGGALYSVGLDEIGAARDALIAAYSALAALTEAGASADELTAAAQLLAGLSEAGAALDVLQTTAGLVVVIAEAGQVQDAIAAAKAAIPAGACRIVVAPYGQRIIVAAYGRRITVH